MYKSWKRKQLIDILLFETVVITSSWFNFVFYRLTGAFNRQPYHHSNCMVYQVAIFLILVFPFLRIFGDIQKSQLPINSFIPKMNN